MKFSPKIHNRTRIQPAGAPNQELARTQSVQHIHTTSKSLGTRKTVQHIHRTSSKSSKSDLSSEESLKMGPSRDRTGRHGEGTRGVSHLGVEVLHGDAGGHGGSGTGSRLKPEQQDPCGFVATRGGKATRLVLIKKSGQAEPRKRTEAKLQRQRRRRRAGQSPAGKRVELWKENGRPPPTAAVLR